MGALGERWVTRHGIHGLNGVNGHREAVLPVARRQRLSGVGQDPYGDPTYLDPAYSAYSVMAPTEPAFEPPVWSAPAFDPADYGIGAPATLVGLPDGTAVDLTGATSFYDPASSQHYTLAADGTKLFDDGTVLKPGGDIMTPGGTVVHPNGSLTLPNGSLVPGTTPTVDGTSVAQSITSWLKLGTDVATGVTGILGKLGIIEPPRAPAGAPRAGWVSGSQYRTAAGQVVTPTKLPNGLYQLPDGSTVGAPPSSKGNTVLLVGGALAALVAFGVMRKKTRSAAA